MIQRLRNRISRARSRGRLHAHRAPCRDHHHRHPARDRHPVVPQLPRPRGAVGGPGERPRLHPGVEAFYADHTATGYSGLTSAVLKASYDAGIKNVNVVRATPASYCIQSIVGQATYKKAGPAADITSGAC